MSAMVNENARETAVELCVMIDDKLYISNSRMTERSQEYRYFSSSETLTYEALCDDFGPMNMSCLIRFIQMLEDEIELNPTKKIVYLAEKGRRPFTNGAFLLGSYLIITKKCGPDEVMEKFHSVDPKIFEPFRDATFAPVDFGLSLIDCWRAIQRVDRLGWFSQPTSAGIWGMIDLDEYEHYEDPLNGDLVQVSIYFTAFPIQCSSQ
jgi:cell division cycle 14